MTLPLTIRVEPHPGTTAERIAMAIWLLSDKIGLAVVCDAGGTDMIAVPGCTADQVLEGWQQARMRMLGQARPGDEI